MPVDTSNLFQRGGRELIELLTHCVYAFNTDVVFLFLVREYQFHPQASGAVAIHDVFCAAGAPARISDTTLIPPRDMRLDQAISQLRAGLQQVQQAQESEQTRQPTEPTEETIEDAVAESDRQSEEVELQEAGSQQAEQRVIPAVPLPPRFLFDSIAAQLAGPGRSKIAKLESYYDPKRTPLENLPGGELSAGQRAFVDHVWTPRIRPYLVSAGFWRLATVG